MTNKTIHTDSTVKLAKAKPEGILTNTASYAKHEIDRFVFAIKIINYHQ